MAANGWSLRGFYRTLETPSQRSPAKASRKGLSGCER